MAFRGFTHVERLGSKNIDTDAYLDGHVYVFTKIDGSNGCIWGEPDGSVHYGSRTRELVGDNDNAGFKQFMMQDENTQALRTFCTDNPNLIVYGEWLGHNKFLGVIKRYVQGDFHIFAIYNRNTGYYLPYDDVVGMLAKAGVTTPIIPPIAELDNPTMEDLTNILDKARYNLNANDPDGGEGIVVYNYDYHDVYGHVALGKIVRDEFLQNKNRKKPKTVIVGNESDFIDMFATVSFMIKCQNKVQQALDMDEWENTNKAIGMFINLVTTDLINEDLCGYMKKKKWQAKFDFNIYKKNITIECRKFLGLI